MVGKRRVSTRGRSDATSKKRQPSSEESSSPEPSEEGLPTKVEDGQPLPTVNNPQPDDLSSKQYQSIAESGILAASLQRSRHKWLSEGIFERYWTKPSKRKHQPEPRNPPKDSMVKLGPCTMTIEPHVFEVSLYTVREPQTHPSPSFGQAMQRPILQYGPPNPYHKPSPSAATPHHPAPPQFSNPPPPFISQPTPRHSVPSSLTSPQILQEPASKHPAAIVQSSPNVSTPATSTPNGTPGPSPCPPTKQSPDPVIQMLATKAATDHELKALMKVVASGSASGSQLKVFQKHIDELTAVLQSKDGSDPSNGPATPSAGAGAGASVNGASVNGASVNGASPSMAPQHNQASNNNISTSGYPTSSPAVSTHAAPGSSMGILHPEPAAPPPAQVHPSIIRPKASLSHPKPDISAVVFEFAAGSGDRFLFPKYSILDYHPDGLEVIASFLVVRKGSNSESGGYDPKLDYYQPVTMRIAAHTARILDSFARVVANLDQARKYMDDVMDNMTRAEYVHLAMRLPRDQDEIDNEEEEASESGDHQNNLKAIYAPPGSVRPPKKKIVKQASFAIDRSSAEPWASPGPMPETKQGRTKKVRIADPSKRCRLCHTTETSLWRKAEVEGESATVCNACGIKWKTNTLRGQEGQPKKPRAMPKLNPSLSNSSPAPTPITPIQNPHPGNFAVVNGGISRDEEMRDVA
ncbi:MAG: hypothetical protein M1837_000503 [Sclerophora amabilis]|nr:MAG: hypothetical protein M1837_000503 [Sclerophora amabilis]